MSPDTRREKQGRGRDTVCVCTCVDGRWSTKRTQGNLVPQHTFFSVLRFGGTARCVVAYALLSFAFFVSVFCSSVGGLPCRSSFIQDVLFFSFCFFVYYVRAFVYSLFFQNAFLKRRKAGGWRISKYLY